jgi:mercuric ion transport protein
MAQITRTEPASSATEGAGDDTLVARMIAAGGILGALAASACCILPLVLFSVGMLS